MNKGYMIKHKETGKQFVADSGKKVWSKPGHAKLAYGQSTNHRYREVKLPTHDVVGYGGRVRQSVSRFDDQNEWVIVELTDVDDKGVQLLRMCLGRLTDSKIEKEIIEFLSGLKVDN